MWSIAGVSHFAPARRWPELPFRDWVARIARRDEAWRQRQALAMLDERMLRDIGVTPADVAGELRGWAASQPRG